MNKCKINPYSTILIAFRIYTVYFNCVYFFYYCFVLQRAKCTWKGLFNHLLNFNCALFLVAVNRNDCIFYSIENWMRPCIWAHPMWWWWWWWYTKIKLLLIPNRSRVCDHHLENLNLSSGYYLLYPLKFSICVKK